MGAIMASSLILQGDIIWVHIDAPIANIGRYWIVVKTPDGAEIEVASIKNGKRDSITIMDVAEVFRPVWRMPHNRE